MQKLLSNVYKNSIFVERIHLRRFTTKNNIKGFQKHFIKKQNINTAIKEKEEIRNNYTDLNSISNNLSLKTVPKSIVKDKKDDNLYYDIRDTPIEKILCKQDPRVIIALTCDNCKTRLVKSMSKRSYMHGVVILRCDVCKSLHLIADNLGWFDDNKITIEDIMKEKGQQVVRIDANDGIDTLSPQAIDSLKDVVSTVRLYIYIYVFCYFLLIL